MNPVENAYQATLECGLLHAERRPRASPAPDTFVSTCIQVGLLARFFENRDSEARNCGRACASGDQASAEMDCDCSKYLDAHTWQRTPGAAHVDLPTECAMEDCVFRRLEDRVRNDRHAWTADTLHGIISANLSARTELIAALQDGDIDSELGRVVSSPQVTSVGDLLDRLLHAAELPHRLPAHVFNQDGSVASCVRPDGLCLVGWCEECEDWQGEFQGPTYDWRGPRLPGSYNCPPQPCPDPPHIVRVPREYHPASLLYLLPHQLEAALAFDTGADQVAYGRVREVLHVKLERIYDALVRLGFPRDAAAEVQARQRGYHEWESRVSEYIPMLPRPAISAYLAHEGNVPLLSALDFWEERHLLRAHRARHFPALSGAQPGARQGARRRPLCRPASLHRPPEVRYHGDAWLDQDLDLWWSRPAREGRGVAEGGGWGLKEWKQGMRAWRSGFQKEMRGIRAALQTQYEEVALSLCLSVSLSLSLSVCLSLFLSLSLSLSLTIFVSLCL